MRGKPFLIGLSTGVIGGIAAILLTTPQSGQQIRSNIVSNAKKTKTTLKEMKVHSQSLKESFSTLKYEAKNNIPKIINDLKYSITNFRDEIEPETLKLKEEIAGLQKTITEIENNLSEINNKKKNE
ncbi:YtxH domain-containing protein [Lysinibacillus telephonicus]|uniref:YtxH domain-containing protein n=1 Tax=Lysinibacillus telephonicus TaxID=1714840 RepID=A0A431UUP2_9BACI|nr:YtxH domain-containing protein [Lysinibacillus telephonicus]RTQ94450.1 YtxH domain-containing protein [Lysinibacillus telephonicus]